MSAVWIIYTHATNDRNGSEAEITTKKLILNKHKF